MARQNHWTTCLALVFWDLETAFTNPLRNHLGPWAREKKRRTFGISFPSRKNKLSIRSNLLLWLGGWAKHCFPSPCSWLWWEIGWFSWRVCLTVRLASETVYGYCRFCLCPHYWASHCPLPWNRMRWFFIWISNNSQPNGGIQPGLIVLMEIILACPAWRWQLLSQHGFDPSEMW